MHVRTCPCSVPQVRYRHVCVLSLKCQSRGHAKTPNTMNDVRPCRGYCGAFEHTKRTIEVARICHPILLPCKCHRHVLCLASQNHIWNQGVLRLASLSRIRQQNVDSFNRVWDQGALRQASVNLDTYISGTPVASLAYATRGTPESPNRPRTAPAVPSAMHFSSTALLASSTGSCLIWPFSGATAWPRASAVSRG